MGGIRFSNRTSTPQTGEQIVRHCRMYWPFSISSLSAPKTHRHGEHDQRGYAIRSAHPHFSADASSVVLWRKLSYAARRAPCSGVWSLACFVECQVCTAATPCCRLSSPQSFSLRLIRCTTPQWPQITTMIYSQGVLHGEESQDRQLTSHRSKCIALSSASLKIHLQAEIKMKKMPDF
jgi:hypothetical protein